ncbi:hypothetical protein K8R03_01115 [Candidatus Kaiserbacteria bacterium]|nr:hypothetical protein [Candidatus Kaiserbacteria bacterium]
MMNFTSLWRRFRELYTFRHEPEYIRPLAEIVWRAILFCILISLMCVIAFSVTVFWGVIDTLTTPASSVKPPVALNRAALENMLTQITARRNTFESLKTNPGPVADPSK